MGLETAVLTCVMGSLPHLTGGDAMLSGVEGLDKVIQLSL